MPVVDRQGFERAAAHVDVVEVGEARPRRLQHVGRAVDGDDRGDVRRQHRGQLPGAAAEIANPQRRVEQRQRRLGVERLAEEIGTQPVPLPRRLREERL